MASALAAPRASSRSRQSLSVSERATPRKAWGASTGKAVAGGVMIREGLGNSGLTRLRGVQRAKGLAGNPSGFAPAGPHKAVDDRLTGRSDYHLGTPPNSKLSRR